MKRTAKQQVKEIAALRRMKNEEIDVTDIPEIKLWSKAVVGRFYRPIKKPLTLRLDADVIGWLRSHGKGYQTRINNLLREAMEAQSRR